MSVSQKESKDNQHLPETVTLAKKQNIFYDDGVQSSMEQMTNQTLKQKTKGGYTQTFILAVPPQMTLPRW